MTHDEHKHLIQKTITEKGGIWADLGSGDGAFTLALRDLAGVDVEIYSVDKDTSRLQSQKKNFEEMFPNSNIHWVEQDFTKDLDLPQLDGILMANSLHYVKDQKAFLEKIKKLLKPNGKFIFVEYNIDEGNQWIPYPLSFASLSKLLESVGLIKVKLLEKIPSTYWDEMYSADTVKISVNELREY